ncbi:MAG: hypothetical protein ACRC1Z_19355 [Waterburya sp.]
MHKLLILLNAMVKNNQAWRHEARKSVGGVSPLELIEQEAITLGNLKLPASLPNHF